MAMLPAPAPTRFGLRSGLPEGLAVAAVLAGFFLATLIWQQRPRAAEPPGSIIVTTEHAEIYGLLARGFLRGQLDLDLVPRSEEHTSELQSH